MSGAVQDAAAEGVDENATARTVVVRGGTSRSVVARTPRKGPLVSLTPMQRRVVISAARAGVTIADGLFLSSTVANPLLTVAFIAYESLRAVNDYRRGELNRLGYRTSLTDVALRVGKEVGTAAVGIAIGHGVGTLIGLSAIPVGGQIVTATVLSVALGLCVGTLITRYADRFFIRLQLQAQYGYSPNEQKSRRRFEQLLEAQHDLSSFETCRIVQHYRDYRVACGWESHTDVDDYRASADINMMPVSFQHFAIVQLQRKWGFLNEYDECRKVFKALMLLHHPDKGGDGELVAQLNHDYEIYAFCQGWQGGCPGISQREGDGGPPNTSVGMRRRKRSVIVNFLRSLFLPANNSAVEAEDLRQFGLLALEAGTPPELHRFDEVDWESMDKEEVGIYEQPVFGTSASVKQRSVSRVLASIHRCYQLATEAITFAGLVRLYKEKKEWSELERDIFLFNRLQTFVSVAKDDIQAEGGDPDSSKERSCRGLTWCTRAEAVLKREERREAIVSRCFPPGVSSLLLEALELWKTAQSLAESFFKQSSGVVGGSGDTNSNNANNESAGDMRISEGTGQTLDTLLNIQRALQNLMENSTRSWSNTDTNANESLNRSFMEEVKALGRTASCALAGAHAKIAEDKLRKTCEEYFKGRQRKLETVTSLLNEIHDVQSSLNTVPAEEQDVLRGRHDDFMKQLFLIHYLFGELDAATSELHDIYTTHLPEKSDILKRLPSSCAQSIHEEFHMSRYVKYERERTLINYMNLEIEPRNAMDPSRSPADHEVRLECETEVADVEFALLRAQYVDPITGTVTPCWLKRYVFPKAEGLEARLSAESLFKTIMEHELRIPELCATHRVTCVTDVFSDDYTRQIYFHIPRGGTQLRFGSTHDVRKRIARLGVRWLHDALQCVIDLHSCQLAHGAICLSNFTYDEFGNTTLGFFSDALRDRVQSAAATLDDVIDLGALLHAEVLPYLLGSALPAVSPVRNRSVATGQEEHLTGTRYSEEEVANVYREVADRLIGKVEPRWTLLDARTFVRRFLEFNYNSDERNYLFTKEVSYPAHWATLKTILPVSLVADRRISLHLPSGASVFLNRNLHLWDIYWKCRRKMVQRRGGGIFSMPASLKRHVPFHPCSDDCEVNERFLWHTCRDEEEAWRLCLEGLPRGGCRLRLAPPWLEAGEEGQYHPRCRAVIPDWGVVFRVSLGTVVEHDGGGAFCGPPTKKNATPLSRNCPPTRDLEHSAGQHCVLLKGQADPSNPRDWKVWVPASRVRCYPEFLVCRVAI